MAEGKHPFPSRTRQLSPPAPMVLWTTASWESRTRPGNYQHTGGASIDAPPVSFAPEPFILGESLILPDTQRPRSSLRRSACFASLRMTTERLACEAVSYLLAVILSVANLRAESKDLARSSARPLHRRLSRGIYAKRWILSEKKVAANPAVDYQNKRGGPDYGPPPQRNGFAFPLSAWSRSACRRRLRLYRPAG
jgi:hypothetical protein